MYLRCTIIVSLSYFVIIFVVETGHFFGHLLEDDHIRVEMEHSLQLSVWYPYLPEFCFFFRFRL